LRLFFTSNYTAFVGKVQQYFCPWAQGTLATLLEGANIWKNWRKSEILLALILTIWDELPSYNLFSSEKL